MRVNAREAREVRERSECSGEVGWWPLASVMVINDDGKTAMRHMMDDTMVVLLRKQRISHDADSAARLPVLLFARAWLAYATFALPLVMKLSNPRHGSRFC